METLRASPTNPIYHTTYIPHHLTTNISGLFVAILWNPRCTPHIQANFYFSRQERYFVMGRDGHIVILIIKIVKVARRDSDYIAEDSKDRLPPDLKSSGPLMMETGILQGCSTFYPPPPPLVLVGWFQKMFIWHSVKSIHESASRRSMLWKVWGGWARLAVCVFSICNTLINGHPGRPSAGIKWPHQSE